jgi:hypothetical protein
VPPPRRHASRPVVIQVGVRRLAFAISLLAASSAGGAAAAPVLALDGSFDGSFVWSDSRPASGRLSGYTVHHVTERPSVTLALLGATLDLRGFHARLQVGAGEGLTALHAQDPSRPRASEAWRHLVEAWAGYKLPIGRGVTVDAGLFSSHIGLEVYPTRDNWNATHSFIAELSPFYQAGVRVSYAFNDRVSAKLLWLNGWNLVDQDRGFRSLGAQLAWSSKVADAALNLFAGPARPGDSSDYRVFFDFWVKLRPLPRLQVGAVVDAGLDPRPDATGNDTWYAGGVFLRGQTTSWHAVALRCEFFEDRDGGVLTGTPQRLAELTLTSEAALGPLTLRFEGRVDRSTAPTLDGRTGRQLVVLSLLGAF